MNAVNIRSKRSGFTLVEMAMVLLIVGLLLGGLLPTISGQVERQRTSETEKQLNEIKDTLIGYAIINGRLPCPASSTSNGIEAPSGGTCTTNLTNNAYLPAVTLGLSGTDSSGFIEDGWGNPIRYAVTTGGGSAFTTSISGIGISSIGTTSNLIVCSTASSSNTYCSVSNSKLTENAVAVIYSTGKNGASSGTGTDEAENPNTNSADTDRVFVSHTPSATTGNEFDDLMIWISPNVLVSRMVAAGRLP